MTRSSRWTGGVAPKKVRSLGLARLAAAEASAADSDRDRLRTRLNILRREIAQAEEARKRQAEAELRYARAHAHGVYAALMADRMAFMCIALRRGRADLVSAELMKGGELPEETKRLAA